MLSPSAELPLTYDSDSRMKETLQIAGRDLTVSPVFDTYWRFAAARQAVYEARLDGRAGPWTEDEILKKHRFTNCYRAADRVSQFLIQQVIYKGQQHAESVFFRTLLFKFFNRISTWTLLENSLSALTVDNFNPTHYDEVLADAFNRGSKLYSAAYVVPPPRLGAPRKHTNHLRLLARMLDDGLADRLTNADSMREAFHLLRAYPSVGDFLAFQLLIDLNYSEFLYFDEMDFVVAGPGARDGIHKVFGPRAIGIEAEVIQYMAETQSSHFDRLGLRFEGLRGRPLQLIDCQNLFCEVDKYSRVAHPGVVGLSGRTRIKQRFTARPEPLTAWFPPKWELSDRL
ncbi:nucleotide kinase domain-containing protein [Rhodococcus aerolatus]